MTRCVITCMQPGCKNQIFYDPEQDGFVHLYCETHRTKFGRHSQIRVLGGEKR